MGGTMKYGTKPGGMHVHAEGAIACTPLRKTAALSNTQAAASQLEQRHEAKRAAAEAFVTVQPGQKLSEHDVLEARALYEFADWKPAQICERYGQSTEYIKRLLAYTIRSKLIAKRKHLPEDLSDTR